MKLKRQSLLFTAFFIFTLSAQAQTIEELKEIDKKYIACLDEGANMLGCSRFYYSQMDSLLNVAYNKLRIPLDKSGKAALKNQQIKWLEKRDAYFEKIDREYAAENSNGFAGNDSRMIAMDEKAQFVRKRIEALINKLGNS